MFGVAVRPRISSKAQSACTVMRLGDIMENHVSWGEVHIKKFIWKTVGAVLGVINVIKSKRSFSYILRKTNRKAKYNLVFNMYCIGFFCSQLRDNHSRDPPLKDSIKKIF